MGRRRWVVAIGWCFGAVLLAAAAFLAGRATLMTPTVAEQSSAVQTVPVAEGTLGRAVAVPVVATWQVSDLAHYAGGGTVTSLGISGAQEASSGTVLYTVDLRPVVLIDGAVPAFRDMSVGASGEDISQLQAFLAQAGYSTKPPSGTFTADTAAAVKAWQRKLGVQPTGVVGRGDVVFASPLPCRVVLAPGIVVGATVGPGEVVVQKVSAEPAMTARVDSGLYAGLESDPTFEVGIGEYSWSAGAGETTQDETSGQLVVTLTGPDGGPACGDECSQAIPMSAAQPEVVLRGRMVVVPEVAGPQVPKAAVLTDAQGATYVVTASGERVDVTVQAMADGQAIVSGVDVGDRVRLHG